MITQSETSSIIVLNPHDDNILLERQERTYSILEGDPDEWMRNNTLKKTMLMKANLLSRMGLGSRAFGSLSKENMKRMSTYHERERKRQDQEEEEIIVEQSYLNSNGDFSLDFVEKTDIEVRQGYINRLINMKILKLQPSKKHQHVIIFDWDDTLLCTSFLLKLGVVDVSSDIMLSIRPIDDSACKLLAKAVSYGEVFIVTNYEEGWVQYSAKFFMPKTLEIITQKGIQVISARTKFQRTFPTDNSRWKLEAFLELKKKYDTNIATNILCLGDSNIEIEAAHILAKQFNQAMIKTVKFKETPQPEELLKQIDLVFEKFDTIFTKLKNLTVKLEKRSSSLR